jgi:FkbM family methyltransferase
MKRLAAVLPNSWQHELRRRHFRREIRRGRFYTDEKEYALLDTLLGPSDWALDVGANVGHYTMRMAELVGPSGRIIALEPVPDTFSLLACNARLFAHANVTLLNVAASDRVAIAGMQIPRFESGLSNYYQARLSAGSSGLAVLTLSIDELSLPPVRLVKIDVEGHEMPALRGMRGLLARDHPALIVESGSQETMTFLGSLDYTVERLPGSSNLLCRPRTTEQV